MGTTAERSDRWMVLALGVLAATLVVVWGLLTDHGPALADEYVYLADAKHFATTGGLETRFYLAESILRYGHPLKDVHAPGYVLVLGTFMRVFPGEYWSAVGLNAACYVLSAFLVWDLSRRLGRGSRASWISAALYLVLPQFLVLVFWAMAEVVLGTMFLLTVWVAARYGHRARGAVVAGILFGMTFLVRESALFGLPALVGLLSFSRRNVLSFLAAAVAFIALVYVPLSRDRAEGGANVLRPGFSHASAYDVFVAGKLGRFREAGHRIVARAGKNYRELTQPAEGIVAGSTERGVLLMYLFLPLWALSAWPSLPTLQRRFLVGLLAGWLAMIAVLFGFFVIVQWSGYRYLMFLMPAFLPWIAREEGPPASRVLGRWLVPLTLAVMALAIDARTLGVLNPFKATRSGGAAVTAYVESYLRGRPERVLWKRQYDYGLRHYPTEVIVWPPAYRADFKALEHAVWFDYVVLPVGSSWAEGRNAHYERVNANDPHPPAWIYRRLK